MKIKEGFVKRPIMDDMVVVPTGDASKDFEGIIKLNPSASLIWDMIDEGKSIDDIVEKFTEVYDVSAESARRDIDAIVNQMIDAGVIE
ncbi:MAG: PqqD family protein [Coriobacteriia bacterium]|nr:PqqD family protein [Coriobacteriia bacterium]